MLRLSHLPRWFTIPFLAFLITRLVVFGALYIPKAAGIVLFESPTFNFAPMDKVPQILNPWARWDSGWYVRIAEQGYLYVPNSALPQENDVAFLPLYPLLIHVGLLFINNSLLVGIILSNVFFLLALIFLYQLAEHYFNKIIAARTIIYISIFPTSFFFSAAYTESLFLLLSVLAALYCSKHQWAKASVCAALASATRVQGVILIVLIGFEWAQVHGLQLANIRQKQTWQNLYYGAITNPSGLLCMVLIPSGLLCYMIYLQLVFGNAFAFNDAMHAWGRQTVGPIAAITSAINLTFSEKPELAVLPYYRLVEIAAFFVGLWLSYWVYRRMGIGYGLYCLISIWVSASGLIQGQLRYSIVLFPLFMVMAKWAKPRFNTLYLTICFILLPLFTFCFTNWIFIG